MEDKKSILIVGRPNSGKTTFMAQLSERLEMDGAVELEYAPDDRSVIEDAQDRLADGLAIEHTATEASDTLSLPVKTKDGKSYILDYPDYGGEQINRIIEQRNVDERWQGLIEKSDYWLVFINVDKLTKPKDITTTMINPIEKTGTITKDFELSKQAFFIELLQMLLYVKGLGLHRTLKQPKICIALSCWDTLEKTDIKPTEYIQEYLPLLYSFINNLWSANARSIIGLSSQGKALNKDKADEEYLEKGAFEFGYVVEPNGKKNKDLTWVIAQLLAE
jgi:GTPase SAR1 family protein